jgi:cell division control protein 6
MLRQIVNHLRHEGKFLLLTLDDVDYLIRMSKEKREEGGVVFDLTRLNEMFLGEFQQVVGVIFIARDASFKKLLDPSERSTLGNVVIKLPGYDAEQLRDILRDRVDDAFRSGAIGDEIVEFVAELASGKSYNPGDCRFALDILLVSGLIADAEDSESISIEHVRKAASESFDGISSEDLMALDEHTMLILIGAVQALGFYKTPTFLYRMCGNIIK